MFQESGSGVRRPRALWRLVIQFAGFVILLTLVANVLVAAWVSFSPAAVSGPGQELAGSAEVLVINGFASLVAVFVSVGLAARFLDRRPLADFGLRIDAGWWLDLFLGLFLGALLMTAIFVVQLAFGWVSVTGTFETAAPDAPFFLAVLVPLTAFVFVGIYEELLSRGYQLRNIAEGLNYPSVGPRGAIVIAWVLTSVFFGFLHLGNPNATLLTSFNIALAGLLLGAGYVLTGELAIPIGLHITWNFFQGTVFGFPVSGIEPIGASFISIEQSGPEIWTGGAFGPEGGLLDPIAVLAGSLLIVLWVRLRHGRVRLHLPLVEPPKTRSESPGAEDPLSGRDA